VNTHKREIQGTVIKQSGDKTYSILVERKIMHPRYRKYVKKHKKYLIHDEANSLGIGDLVTAVECRPLSKTKSFRLGAVLKKGVIV
jgi:small subunit ribosomal protein S17